MDRHKVSRILIGAIGPIGALVAIAALEHAIGTARADTPMTNLLTVLSGLIPYATLAFVTVFLSARLARTQGRCPPPGGGLGMGDPAGVERPWTHAYADPRWVATPHELAAARARAREVAAAALGDEAWQAYVRARYLEVPSRLYHGVSYIIRPGKRVEVRLDGAGVGAAPPRAEWRERRYLCVEPAYALPKDEFAAQLYIQLRDMESHVVLTANAQRIDADIGNVF